MAEGIEEYKEGFREDKRELLVRISWCYKKGKSGGFGTLGDYYKARARFDMALDAATGELLATKGFCWLEWLAPKKTGPFGFKYGYKLKEGKVYRILAREYINKPSDKFVKYYVEDVLEHDVKEKSFDPVYLFGLEYGDEIFDLAVLIKNRIIGYVCSAGHRTPGTTVIASVDLRTQEIDGSPASLRWIEKDSCSSIKYNFNDLGIYHIRARKSKTNANSYMLVDVVKKVKNEKLEQVKEEYIRPVTFMHGEAEFILDRRYNRFEGSQDYLGEKCEVWLEVLEGDISVKTQLQRLDEIFTDLPAFDNRVREFVACELLEFANDDWLAEEEDAVTKEEFVRRIGIPLITIYPEGSMSLMFESDGMFTDHVITVEINASGEIEEAKIQG